MWGEEGPEGTAPAESSDESSRPRWRFAAERSQHDAGLQVQSRPVLDRLADQQLSVLPGPSGVELLRAGMTEDEIAALDCDWSQFTPAEQAAFALTRKLTLTPHEITDADIDEVRKHFTDQQILEMIVSIAGNNAINRWKEGVGVPQSEGGGGFGRRSEVATDPPPAERRRHSYLTPTSEKYQTTVSLVAPLFIDEATGAATRKTVERRPPLEPRIAVEKALEATRTRQPRLPLLSEQQAREALQEAAPEGPLPNWMRLVGELPPNGKAARHPPAECATSAANFVRS